VQEADPRLGLQGEVGGRCTRQRPVQAVVRQRDDDQPGVAVADGQDLRDRGRVVVVADDDIDPVRQPGSNAAVAGPGSATTERLPACRNAA